MSDTANYKNKIKSLASYLKYLKYIYPLFLIRLGVNKLLQYLFNRKISDLKNDSSKFLIGYLILRRLVREMRRDGLNGVLDAKFIGIMGAVIIFYLAKRSYEDAVEPYEIRENTDLEQLKDLGKIPDSFEYKSEKPTVTDHFLSFVVSDKYASAVSDKVSFVVTPVFNTLSFIWDSAKSVLYFIASRFIVWIVLGVLFIGYTVTTGVVSSVIGLLALASSLLYISVELSRSENEFLNETVYPKVANISEPIDKKLTQIEVFKLGLKPRPEEIPESLRIKWGVPEPDEYDGKLEIIKTEKTFHVERID